MLSFPSPPDWIPAWAFSLGFIALALAGALVAHELLVRALQRGLKRRGAFAKSLLVRTRAPSRFALLVLALSWAVRAAPIDERWARMAQHLLLAGFIVLVGWAVMAAVDIGSALYMRRFRTDLADNLHARKLLTQTRILRRLANVVVLVITTAMVLMTIPGVKQLGVSLLAAGGAAGIIVGLALQPVLSNLLAGIQIAFTQPIRLDDAVVIEGEFGHVEEIKAAYVVVRLWDLRRLVVPLKYFLEQPFQNWTRESSNLLQPITLYVDPQAPIGALRTKLEELVRASPLWDGQVVKTQVNEIREQSLEIRCLVSARNSGDAGDLRAEVREKIIGWLQAEHPDALPRGRLEVVGDAPAAGAVQLQ